MKRVFLVANVLTEINSLFKSLPNTWHDFKNQGTYCLQNGNTFFSTSVVLFTSQQTRSSSLL